jgi:hypothetical protein
MTSLVGDFDKHKNINYQPITRIFWNEYPFKVLVFEDLKRPDKVCWGGNSVEDKRIYQAWLEHRQARKVFYYARMRHCPEKSGWRSMNNGGHTFSFFFKDQEAAKHFIEKNRKHITDVFRPENLDQVTALSQNNKLLLRDSLFWGKYRYCIEFKEQYEKALADHLDERVLELFHNKKNDRRYLYTFSKRRRLYLKNENDIFYVKMALYEYVRSQTEALLKKDIK